MSLSRRTFIRNSGITIIASGGFASVAWSDSLPILSESDPLAMSLGYKANASAVDAKKFSRYAAGQMCSTCALYQGAPGSSSGPCQIYAGKVVSANGWCASYSKKA